MKYKKKLARLEARRKWYDQQNQLFQKANKRPGSIK